MSSSSSTSDDQRKALLETLRGYKVRTAPSQLFPGQCGVVAIASIAKGESVFPCNGELSNDVIDLTFEEVASLPSHSRKLVWAFFQPNQDPCSLPREELTFPVPVNGLIHAGNSFFCNSADGTGQDANVETGTKIDGSGYAELVAMRDIQVGEELLDSYPIWDYDGSGEFLSAVGDGVDAVELLGFDISSDEAQEILDLRYHMANLKAKVARLEELRDNNEGQIAGLKRQVASTSSDNFHLKTKMARLTEAHQKETNHLKLAHERAMADLKRAHEKEVADLERQAAAGKSNNCLWWGCVNQISYAGGYRDTSTTESESEDDDVVDGGIAPACSVTGYQANAHDAVDVDIGRLFLSEGTPDALAGNESNGEAVDSANTASPINQAASNEAEVVSGAERTNNPALPDCAETTQHRWNSAEERIQALEAYTLDNDIDSIKDKCRSSGQSATRCPATGGNMYDALQYLKKAHLRHLDHRRNNTKTAEELEKGGKDAGYPFLSNRQVERLERIPSYHPNPQRRGFVKFCALTRQAIQDGKTNKLSDREVWATIQKDAVNAHKTVTRFKAVRENDKARGGGNASNGDMTAGTGKFLNTSKKDIATKKKKLEMEYEELKATGFFNLYEKATRPRKKRGGQKRARSVVSDEE